MADDVFFESSSELATITNTFTVGGDPTDPDTVSLKVTSPSAVETTYATADLTKVSTGVYSKDVVCSEAGEWQFEWTGTGAAADVTVGTWQVFETGLGKLYATVEALKNRLGVNDTVDNFDLHEACFAASRSIEQYCERTFWRTPADTVRTFTPDSPWCLDLPEYNDLVAVTSLKTDAAGDGTFETTWATSDYQLWPVNPDAAPETKPYTRIMAVGSNMFPCPVALPARRDLVQITGTFGWPSVPYGIRQAALILAAETFKLREAPFGVAGFGDFGVVRIRENPKVAAFAAPYRRNGALVA